MQSEYAQEFAVFKPDKKLKWLPHLGTVQLEIELGDRKLEVDVPPLEAAFIELFSQKRDFLFTIFLDVLDLTDWPIFLSYLSLSGFLTTSSRLLGLLIEARLSRRCRYGSITVFS
jgi:anaphase-promoting complex subunit 2